MALPADQVVVDRLVAAGIGLTLGTNLFRGEVRPPKPNPAGGFFVPHQAVFCLLTGGPTPRSQVRGNTGLDIREPTVQVRTRGEASNATGDSFELAQALAEAVWKALQRFVPVDYMMITMREAAPQYLGQDDTRHPEWVNNTETMLED
jgi:hypothetical protein